MFIRKLIMFKIPIILIVSSIILLLKQPLWLKQDNFGISLVASILGVGISIFTAESYKKLSEHKRLKKTFGLLRLTTIPYLKNQYESILETLRLYQDICSLEQAKSFLLLVSNFELVSSNFDKSWLQLIYSQDFIDAIESDDQINNLSHAIFEILIFTQQFTTQSINTKNLLHLLSEKSQNLKEEEIAHLLINTRQTRNSLNDTTYKLKEYTEKLDQEIDKLFKKYGVKYMEIAR